MYDPPSFFWTQIYLEQIYSDPSLIQTRFYLEKFISGPCCVKNEIICTNYNLKRMFKCSNLTWNRILAGPSFASPWSIWTEFCQVLVLFENVLPEIRSIWTEFNLERGMIDPNIIWIRFILYLGSYGSIFIPTELNQYRVKSVPSYIYINICIDQVHIDQFEYEPSRVRNNFYLDRVLSVPSFKVHLIVFLCTRFQH